MTTMQQHSRASYLIRTWRPKSQANVFSVEVDDDNGHTLTFPWTPTGWSIRVSFFPVKDHPEWMRVRSTNWRAEDEPNGVYLTTDCRAFWRQLREAGLEET